MIYREIYLEDEFEGLPKRKRKTRLTLYIREREYGAAKMGKFPCVMLCPGGAYSHISGHEAEPVALRLFGEGINVAVCEYCCEPDGANWPDQLLEVSAAMTYIRRNADDLGCDSDKIAVMGFSAGGHVAASLGVYWHKEFIADALRITYGENRPNGMILCYPVITGGEYAHEQSVRNLLGAGYSDELVNTVSLEKHITALTPPAFILHTAADALVPVGNSLLMSMALKQAGIDFEMHIYPEGVHGIALADETTSVRPEQNIPYNRNWITHCINWIKTVL